MKFSRNILFILMLALTIFVVGCSDEGADNDAVESDGDDAAVTDFPTKPIDVVVAYKAGGGTDVGARILTNAAEKTSGNSFVVQNREGAGGEQGYNYLAKSDPDGYTIGFINLPTFVSLPHERTTEYEIDGVEPIMLHVYDPALLVVKPGSDIEDLDSFLSYAEENPDKITVANNGTGASNHIIAAHFELKADISLNHVPFDGTNELVTALRGGHVLAGVAKLSEVMPHIDSGELVAVASMTEDRLDELPDVPTLMENDIDVIGASGRGVVAPKGTDPAIIEKIHDMLKEAVESDEHMEQAENINLPIRYMNPEDFGNFIDEQDKDNQELSELLDL